MNLDIPPEVMQSLVQKAVLDQMTPEAKEKLLVTAISNLFLKPPVTNFNPRVSPLMELFEQQVQIAARAVVDEEFKKPENRGRIVAMVSEAWEKMFTDEGIRQQAVDRMARALGEAISGDRR